MRVSDGEAERVYLGTLASMRFGGTCVFRVAVAMVTGEMPRGDFRPPLGSDELQLVLSCLLKSAGFI